MKVLVTGSTGLIGREVVSRLRAQNVEVVEFSKSLGDHLTDAKKLDQKTRGCHAVIHLAAELNEDAGRNLIFETNVDGTKRVLEACATHRVERLVFVSTVGVHGTVNAVKNEETALSPQTPYEESKAQAEQLVLSYQELVPFTIVRPALVIGPNTYWKQIIALVRQNFPMPGVGTQKFQTIYYKDLADALVFLLFLDTAENETFLLAGEEQPTLREVVQTIRTQLGLSKEPKTLPLWTLPLVGFLYGLWARMRNKPNLLSAQNRKRLLHERAYDLTKIHAYGWKARFGYAAALKQTISEINQK